MKDKIINFLKINWFKLIIALFILLGFYFFILHPVLVKQSCYKNPNGRMIRQGGSFTLHDGTTDYYGASYQYKGYDDCLKAKGV